MTFTTEHTKITETEMSELPNSYMRLAGCRLGLLINFNVPLIKDGIYRVII